MVGTTVLCIFDGREKGEVLIVGAEKRLGPEGTKTGSL
jgi:hypothetical protein